jgi:hypothetical protein
MLSIIGDALNNSDSITVGADLLICNEQTLVGLIKSGSTMSTMKFVTALNVTVCDLGLELVTIEQRVRAITNTRGVIGISIVVRESTPLRSSVDNTITHNQAARSADDVSRREFLMKVGRPFLAVLTHNGHIEILAPFCVLCGHHLWLVRLRSIDVVKFVKHRALWFAPSDFASLARYSSTSS